MGKNRCDSIGNYISQIYRKYRAYIAKAFSEQGIGSGQLMFLMELYKCDGRIQEDLSESLNIDKGTTARALKKLEDENLVFRKTDESDKRAYNVYLTEKGKEKKSIIYSIFDEYENLITKSLSSEEQETLIKLLKKICINENNENNDNIKNKDEDIYVK